MPKARIDEDAALRAIRTVLDDFKSTSRELATELDIRSFDWKAAAMAAGVERSKLYHWFSDTFKRQFYQQITANDMRCLKMYVRQKLNLGQEIRAQDVESVLTRSYERRQVTIAISNCKAGYKKMEKLQTGSDKLLVFDDSISADFNPFVFSVCCD